MATCLKSPEGNVKWEPEVSRRQPPGRTQDLHLILIWVQCGLPVYKWLKEVKRRKTVWHMKITRNIHFGVREHAYTGTVPPIRWQSLTAALLGLHPRGYWSLSYRNPTSQPWGLIFFFNQENYPLTCFNHLFSCLVWEMFTNLPNYLRQSSRVHAHHGLTLIVNTGCLLPTKARK